MRDIETVYLDYNATTPLGAAARAALLHHLDDYENPSSAYPRARAVKQTLEKARADLAHEFGARPSEVTFTASGTEAINTALLGVAMEHLGRPCRIITTRIEHSATLATCKRLESWGIDVAYLPVDARGLVAVDELRKVCTRDTKLVSVMHANNEVGVVQPIEALSAIAHESGALFLTDAVQTAGKLRVDFAAIGVDFMAISAHKFHGPKGMGALFRRDGVNLGALINGGGQESGLRGGTENLPGAVAMAAAARESLLMLEEKSARVRALRDQLWANISQLELVRLNGDLSRSLPGTLNVSFAHVKGDALAAALAFEGVAVSTGSACHEKEARPSHVLQAMGTPPEWLFGAVRFSLGPRNTDAEVSHASEKILRIVRRLRAMNPNLRRGQVAGASAQRGEA